MSTFPSDLFPSTHREKPPTVAEHEALSWHAGNEVMAALDAGIIADNQIQEHWDAVYDDTRKDTPLLKKLVNAHERWKAGDAQFADSKKIVLEHDAALEPIAKIDENGVTLSPARGYRRHGLIAAGAAAAMLGMAAGPLQGGSLNNNNNVIFSPQGPHQRNQRDDIPEAPAEDREIKIEHETTHRRKIHEKHDKKRHARHEVSR